MEINISSTRPQINLFMLTLLNTYFNYMNDKGVSELNSLCSSRIKFRRHLTQETFF
jgi:hypothetical protein